MNLPTEDEIKRTIHVRLQAILDRAKHEEFDARLENVQAKAALDAINAKLKEEDNFGFMGTSQYEVRLKHSEEKLWKCAENITYWETVRDWADEKLIGPITEEAKRN